jgi:hypothetical protein
MVQSGNRGVRSAALIDVGKSWRVNLRDLPFDKKTSRHFDIKSFLATVGAVTHVHSRKMQRLAQRADKRQERDEKAAAETEAACHADVGQREVLSHLDTLSVKEQAYIALLRTYSAQS